jgi:hypothetical protein
LLETLQVGIKTMKNKQVFYWFLDLVILVALVLEYELDWTGLQVHELLGLAAFGLMLVHLIAHWRWVASVTEKVFESVSSKAAFYYVIDAILLVSFASIIITGLIISSLLSLPLQSQTYDFWRFLHVTVSYLTLVMVGLKIAVHWKWIVNTTKRKIFRTSQAVPFKVAEASDAGMSRRQFLAQTGLFSGAMIVAGVSYASWMKRNLFDESGAVQAAVSSEVVAAEPQIIYITATPEVTQIEAASVVTDENSSIIEQPLVIATSEPTAVPTTVVTSVKPAAASSSLTSNVTSVRCTRGCSYPGHCRRYEDSNGNNKCDLSEW